MMAGKDMIPASATEEEEREATIALLGGARGIGGKAESLMELHSRMAKGFPLGALRRFEQRCPGLAGDDAFARMLGLPEKFDRRRRLSAQQSGHLWNLATLVVTAAPVLGGIEATERWLLQPAFGLVGQRPLDLLETPAGQQLVTEHLIRIAYGTYT